MPGQTESGNGLGEDDYQEAVLNPAIAERVARGELFALENHYLSGQLQVELHPLFNVFLRPLTMLKTRSEYSNPMPGGISARNFFWKTEER